MTSTSKQRETEMLINQQLDQESTQLSESVRADIANARMQALRTARENKQKPANKFDVSGFMTLLANYKWQLSMPTAVAVAVVILVSYTSRETIPALPSELLVADIPTEDLGLLEELEFATWLAQQEQEATN